MINISNLPIDIQNIIVNKANIICHVCQKKYKFKMFFYKKQNKFYFCSKSCYNLV
jgi:hypothetical protein